MLNPFKSHYNHYKSTKSPVAAVDSTPFRGARCRVEGDIFVPLSPRRGFGLIRQQLLVEADQWGAPTVIGN